MQRKPFLATLAAALVLAVFGQDAAAQTTKLVANITKAQDDFATIALRSFAERVGKLTDGKVAIEVHIGGALGYKTADGLRILQNRSVDISETVGAFESGVIADIGVTTLPFFITSFDEFEFFDRLYRPLLDKQFGEKNAKCLASFSLTLQHFWNKKAVNTLADLTGVKMRAYDKITNDMLVAVGAAPLRVDFSEIYTALQQGTVSGLVTSIASIISTKAYEVVSHGNLTGFSTGGINCFAINTDSWKALAPAHQVAMMQAARETEDWLRVRVPEIERDGSDLLRSRGMTIQQVPAATIEEMRKRTQPVRDEFLTKTASAELRAIVDKYEKIRGLKK